MITHWFIAAVFWWGGYHSRPILPPPIYIPPSAERPIEKEHVRPADIPPGTPPWRDWDLW